MWEWEDKMGVNCVMRGLVMGSGDWSARVVCFGKINAGVFLLSLCFRFNKYE